jgi:hypothetical protein
MEKLFFALAASLFAVSSYAQSTDDFDFENDTNGTVIALYVSPHALSRWGHNVLGQYISSDQNTHVYFPEEPAYDVYDIRVDFPSQKYEFTEGYNLSTISSFWVTYNGGRILSLNWK